MEHGVRPSLNVQVGFRQFGNLLVQLDVALTKPSHHTRLVCKLRDLGFDLIIWL